MKARKIHKDIRKRLEQYCPEGGWLFRPSERKPSHFKVYAPDGVFCGVMCGGLNSDRSLDNLTAYLRQWRREWEERQ